MRSRRHTVNLTFLVYNFTTALLKLWQKYNNRTRTYKCCLSIRHGAPKTKYTAKTLCDLFVDMIELKSLVRVSSSASLCLLLFQPFEQLWRVIGNDDVSTCTEHRETVSMGVIHMDVWEDICLYCYGKYSYTHFMYFSGSNEMTVFVLFGSSHNHPSLCLVLPILSLERSI